MTPDQLRRTAAHLTAGTASPDMRMTPGEYVRSDAIYELARALREVADEDEIYAPRYTTHPTGGGV